MLDKTDYVSTAPYDATGEIVYPVGLIPTDGLRLWLSGDSGMTLDESSGKVASWADKSGAGNSVSQCTGQTDSNGEKMLVVDTIDTRTSGEEIGALGMLNKSLTPSGVLTRVWGRVTETGDDYFIVNDGSGSPVVVDTTSLVTPITVTIQTGQYVTATGLAGLGDGGMRVVRPRSDADIQTY